MRKATRTIAIATILATTLSVTPLFAAGAVRSRNSRRDNVSIAQMVRNIMKRLFNVSSQAEVSVPIPEANPAQMPSETMTTFTP